MVDEQTTDKESQEKPAEAAGDSSEGHESKANAEIEQLNADTERLEKAIAEHKNAEARAKVAGISLGPQPEEKPKELTPQEALEEHHRKMREGLY